MCQIFFLDTNSGVCHESRLGYIKKEEMGDKAEKHVLGGDCLTLYSLIRASKAAGRDTVCYISATRDFRALCSILESLSLPWAVSPLSISFPALCSLAAAIGVQPKVIQK